MKIAVVGIGCRFPGAQGPDEFWRLLQEGRDMTREVPADRFNVDAVYAPESGTPGKTASRKGAFVDQADKFDAEFFQVSAKEAAKMDPQQRLLLMSAWDALEDAGQPPSRVAGSRTSVFVGMMNADYWDLQHRNGIADMDLYSFTGMHQRSLASGRLSYAFDLRGPSVTIDAACASSLVAIHLACKSLRSGESTMALACGVNLVLTPHENVMYSQVGMMAPDGRCKFGDATANGFVRAEGIGVLVLKPLERALADGDRVRAVILGSAVSNDGRSKDTLTAPSVVGQDAAIRWAYEDAGIAAAEVDYVEAHGTGTRIDLVELNALSAILAPGRPAERPCIVGSVKTNIGHAEGAAGVAGVIKTVLCLQNGLVPPNLHFDTPHPKLDWDSMPLIIPTQAYALGSEDKRAIASVSGQGISSTNACIVLTQAEPAAQRAPAQPDRPHAVTLSAPNPAALDKVCRSLLARLEEDGAQHHHALRDIAYTTTQRRAQHASRVAFVAASHEELALSLRRYLSGGVGGSFGDDGADRDGDDGLRRRLERIAEAYMAGEPVDWSEVSEPGGRLVDLPAYPWQLERHWLDLGRPEASRAAA